MPNRSKVLVAFFTLLYLSFFEFAFAGTGGEVGNGGDSVYCSVGGDNNLVGYFSLDYLLTYRVSNNNSDVIDRTWEESRARISRLLAAKHSALGRSFDRFVSLLYNTDPLKSNLWNEASFGLEDISDERMLRKLPPNCVRRNDRGTPEVLQAVVRVAHDESTVYEYDYDILENLQSNAGLQYSFLIVHEWLWDFTGDVHVIREVNRLLHSSQLEGFADSDSTIAAIENLGISFHRPLIGNPCRRSQPIKNFLERSASLPCNLIDVVQVDAAETGRFGTSGTLHRFGYRFWYWNEEEIKLGDFAGLSNIGDLVLSGSSLRELRAFDFAGLVGVRDIHLDHGTIHKIEAHTFDGLNNLYEIFLQNNEIESVQSAAFNHLPGLSTLALGNNKIRTIPSDLLRRIATGARPLSISLHNNLLESFPIGLCDGISGEHAAWISLYGNPSLPDTLAELQAKAPCVDFDLSAPR
jgi:Leucine-rich repeat (LRR) protein